MAVKSNGRILFSSLKGGVGKSTAACLVASALAGDGYKVVLVDLDFRSRSLDLILGVSDSVVFTFDDYLLDRCNADQLLVPVPDYVPTSKTGAKGSLLLCAAPSESVFESVEGDMYGRIPEALDKLYSETEADYIVCDTGADSRIPGIVADRFATLALIVSEQSRTSVRAAETTAANLIKGNTMREVRLVINNFDIEVARRGGRAGILEMIDGSSVRCIGVIPADENLAEVQDKGAPPLKDSSVIPAARNIARRIQGIETPLFYKMKKERRRVTL